MKRLKVSLRADDFKKIALFLFLLSSILPSFKRSDAHAFSSENSQIEQVDNQDPGFEISQGPLPEYLCDTGAEITNPASPLVNWRSSITCLRGTPSRIEMFVYYANVNFPGSYTYVGKNTFTCGGGTYCVTPNYSRTLSRTQMFHVVARIYVKGATTGIIYQDPRQPSVIRAFNSQPSVIRAFNNRGVMYPEIKPTRTDMARVPYYGPPYSVIATRNNTFASDLRGYYSSKGWTIPPSPEAHHIKPLSWGGDNNYIVNGVFLGPATHRLFTDWWLQFSNLNW